VCRPRFTAHGVCLLLRNSSTYFDAMPCAPHRTRPTVVGHLGAERAGAGVANVGPRNEASGNPQRSTSIPGCFVSFPCPSFPCPSVRISRFQMITLPKHGVPPSLSRPSCGRAAQHNPVALEKSRMTPLPPYPPTAAHGFSPSTRLAVRQRALGGENRESGGVGVNPPRSPPAANGPAAGNSRNISEPVPLSPPQLRRRWVARFVA
jgi:hypothetical protein